jgi:hypothetical protein
MAITKTIIQSSGRETTIKLVGSGTETITLASLVHGSQTVTGVPAVSIMGVLSSNSSVATISRNGSQVLHMHGSFEYQTDGLSQSTLSENASNDIVADLQQTGTLIIRVRKLSGYSEVTL